MQPFQLILRPSKRLAWVSAGAHVASVWVMLAYFEAWQRVLGVSVCLTSAAWWWRGRQRGLACRTLAVDSKGHLAIIDRHGVKIIGYSNTPAHLAADASALYARNLYNFLSAFWDKEVGKPVLDEEIGNAVRLTQGGKVVNERLLG